MSVISVCSTLADSSKELATYKANAEALCTEFTSTLATLVNSDEAKTANAMADSAFTAANTMLNGNLSKVMTDANLSKPDETFEESRHSLMVEGYLFATNRVYFVATPTWKMHESVSNGVYKYIGTTDGEYTTEELETLLKNYTEPTYSDVMKNLHKRSSVRADALNTSSIGPVYKGNIADLRELYIGCGSDVSTLKSLIIKAQSSKYGVVWSRLNSKSVLRPLSLTVAQFTTDKARELAEVSVRSSDVVKMSNDEYMVLYEEHVALNCSRQVAYETGVKSGALESNYDKANLICRAFVASEDDDLCNGAPLFTSKGFDASKLDSTHYQIGVLVQGIARVIDITNDTGSKLSTDTYTSASVAHAIRSVFPDLVETGTAGTEWFVKLKTAGTEAVLAFFAVDKNSAAEACGLAGGLSAMYGITFSTTDTALIEIPGGDTNTPNLPTSFLKAMSGFELTSEQSNAILKDNSTYWSDVKSQLSTGFTEVYKDSIISTTDIETIESMLPTVSFVFIDDMRCQEALNILGILGSDTDYVMRRTDIIIFDTYTEAKTVQTTLKSDLEKVSQGSGISSSTTGSADTTLSVRDQNYSQVTLLYLLASVCIELKSRGNDVDYSTYFDKFVTAAESSSAATNSIATTSSTSTTFQSLSRIADDYTAILNRLPETTDGILSDAALELASLTTSFLKSNFPELYSKFTDTVSWLRSNLSNASDAVNDELSDAYSVVKDLESAYASAESLGIRLLQRANILLESVTPVVASYASAYQATYKKLAALCNLNLNIMKSVGTSVSTKLVTCYVTGDASLELQIYLDTYLSLINKAVDAVNKIIEGIIKAVRKFITSIDCLLNAIKASAAGTISYSSTYPLAGGAVSVGVTCSSSTGLQVSPEIMANLTSIANQIDGLLSMFKVHLATYNVQTTCNDSATKQSALKLQNSFLSSLDEIKSCF